MPVVARCRASGPSLRIGRHRLSEHASVMCGVRHAWQTCRRAVVVIALHLGRLSRNAASSSCSGRTVTDKRERLDGEQPKSAKNRAICSSALIAICTNGLTRIPPRCDFRTSPGAADHRQCVPPPAVNQAILNQVVFVDSRTTRPSPRASGRVGPIPPYRWHRVSRMASAFRRASSARSRLIRSLRVPFRIFRAVGCGLRPRM